MRETVTSVRTTSVRLFFALWPDAALCRQLHVLGGELLGRHSGRRIPPENLHLTLAFPGTVDPARKDCLVQMVTATRIPVFKLTLDQVGFWPRKGILWVGGTAPTELLALVQEINRVLQRCGLAPASRPYQIHLTLARNVDGLCLDPGRTVAPVVWEVSRYALVASQTLPEGARYEIVRNWELAV